MVFKKSQMVKICISGAMFCILVAGSIQQIFADCNDYDITRIGRRDINDKNTDLNIHSLAQDIHIGSLMARDLEEYTRFIEDESIQNYINFIGMEIVNNSDARTPFIFKVIDSNEINVFALPGGHVYICMGIIEYVETEAELVGLLAHEVSRVTARHATEELSRKWGFKKFLEKIPLFGLIPSQMIRKKALGLSIDITVLGITPDNEIESDC